jgi:hypothetical protein
MFGRRCDIGGCLQINNWPECTPALRGKISDASAKRYYKVCPMQATVCATEGALGLSHCSTALIQIDGEWWRPCKWPDIRHSARSTAKALSSGAPSADLPSMSLCNFGQELLIVGMHRGICARQRLARCVPKQLNYRSQPAHGLRTIKRGLQPTAAVEGDNWRMCSLPMRQLGACAKFIAAVTAALYQWGNLRTERLQH